MIERFIVSRDDEIYEAFPDLALTPAGKLVCVFAECTHHSDRSYTRMMFTTSTDRGRTWYGKRPLTEATHGETFYDCPRITQLRDGRLAALVDKHHGRGENPTVENSLLFSDDEGETWSAPVVTAADGIVPDKLLELASGRWLIASHHTDAEINCIAERLWYSDDKGKSWTGPVVVGRQEGLNLCEASIIPVRDCLVAFMRENSHQGWDCYKTISRDNGETWSEPIRFPLPGCHRPVAGHLADGHILITHRYMQGGKGWLGYWTQNFFAALTDDDSALAETRDDAWTRILPIDYDRSAVSDLGYSGWVQFDNGEIYIVTYIVDDAPKAHIRGYSLRMGDFLLTD